MEITPEMYLDVASLELHGPDALNKPAETPSAPAPSDDIFAVQQQLLDAERVGNHLAVQQLSMRLDDLLAGISPEQPSEDTAEQESTDEPSEAHESSSEADEIDVTTTELYQQIGEAVGAQKADETFSYMNDNASQEEISEFLEQLKAGDQEAISTFQAAQQAMEQGITIDGSVETTAFDSDTAFLIEDRFGENGVQIVDLNRRLLAGEITQVQVKRAVMSNPSLLADCLKAKAANLISF